MGADPRKRQKKLAKKAAKRKEKKHHAIVEANKGIAERLSQWSHCPVLHSRVSTDVWDKGMGYALISRVLPSGRIAIGAFLIDRYCLGVKNAIAALTGRSMYDEKFVQGMKERFAFHDEAPAFVRKLVEQSVAYARDLGFSPHEDYHKAKMIFGDIDATQCTQEFEFGLDGQPFFMRGPFDTPERCRYIYNMLSKHITPEQLSAMIAADQYAPDRLGSEDGALYIGGGEDDFDDELDDEEESR